MKYLNQFAKFTWVVIRESIVNRVELRAPQIVVYALLLVVFYWMTFDFYLASQCHG